VVRCAERQTVSGRTVERRIVAIGGDVSARARPAASSKGTSTDRARRMRGTWAAMTARACSTTARPYRIVWPLPAACLGKKSAPSIRDDRLTLRPVEMQLISTQLAEVAM
jgi:hypothetical protein